MNENKALLSPCLCRGGKIPMKDANKPLELTRGTADSIPRHYQTDGIPTMEICERVIEGLPAKQAVCLFNVLKYALRCNKKGSADEDISKANNYAHRLVTGEWKQDL